jgi:hypothetical protein
LKGKPVKGSHAAEKEVSKILFFLLARSIEAAQIFHATSALFGKNPVLWPRGAHAAGYMGIHLSSLSVLQILTSPVTAPVKRIPICNAILGSRCARPA